MVEREREREGGIERARERESKRDREERVTETVCRVRGCEVWGVVHILNPGELARDVGLREVQGLDVRCTAWDAAFRVDDP